MADEIVKFFKGVGDAITAPIKLAASIPDLVNVAVQILNAIVKIVTCPHKAIPYIFVLVVGLIFCAVLLALHIFLSLPLINDLVFWVYFFVVVLLVELIVSIVFVALFLVIALVDVCIWLLDLLTFGAVRTLTRCEDTPEAWFKRPNFVHDNVVRSIFLLCQHPCSRRFKPTGGFFCSKMNRLEPSFCPQSQIYRIYKGEPLDSPVVMDRYTPDLDFWGQSQEQRKETIKAYFADRQGFLQKCTDKMTKYEGVIRNVCANCDTVPLPSNDPKEREMLKSLCCQVFCQRQPSAEFCAKLQCKSDSGSASTGASISSSGDVIQTIVNTGVVIFIVTMIILMFLHRS